MPERSPPAAFSRWRFIAGCGERVASTSWRGSSPVASRRSAISSSGSSSSSAIPASRPARGCSARRRSAKWPRWRAATISARPCRGRGTGSGWRLFPCRWCWLPCSGLSSRPPRQMPGSGFSRRGDSWSATRLPGSTGSRRRWWSPMASRQSLLSASMRPPRGDRPGQRPGSVAGGRSRRPVKGRPMRSRFPLR